MLLQTCNKLTFGLSGIHMVTVIARNRINSVGSLFFRDSRIPRFGKYMPILPNLRILLRKNNEPTLFLIFRAMTVITSISDGKYANIAKNGGLSVLFVWLLCFLSSKKVRLNTFVTLSLSFSKTCVMSDIAFSTLASRLNWNDWPILAFDYSVRCMKREWFQYLARLMKQQEILDLRMSNFQFLAEWLGWGKIENGNYY